MDNDPTRGGPPIPEGVTLGSFIREKREARNLSLRAAAQAADLTYSYLGQVERDVQKGGPSPRKLLDIAAVLELSPDDQARLFHLAGKGELYEGLADAIALAFDDDRVPRLEILIERDPTLDSDAKQHLRRALRAERARMQLESEPD